MSAHLVLQVPVISTAHIPNEDAVSASECLYAFYEGGWFVYMDDEPDPSSPPWYLGVRAWAKVLGYSWVRFDADGDVIEELPQFVW